MKRFNEFINENINDKSAFLDILREWGVFNPPEFMKYLKEIGYTIIELDPVGTNESISNFNDFDKIFEDDDEGDWEDSDDTKLKNFLRRKGIEEYAIDGFFDSLHDDLGYVIIKDEDWAPMDDDFEPENENKLVMNEYSGYGDYDHIEKIDKIKYKIKDKLNPNIIQSVQKLGTYMHDVYTHGLRARLDSVTDKEQYDHIVQYAYNLKKALKGISTLERKIENISKKRKLTDNEQEWFDRYVAWVIKDGYYAYPWKFKGYLSKYDQEELDVVVSEFNKLVDRNYGKKIYPPKKNEKI